MKAAVYRRYGPPSVLRIEEVDPPVPGRGEVLLRVRAVSLNAYDRRFLMADPFIIRFMGGGFLRPKNPILGADVAGSVEAVGPEASGFKPGDAVFGCLSDCGLGGLAEYVAVPERALVPMPAGASFEDAAALPMAGLTALQALRDRGGIRKGQAVAVYGASGGVGTFAIQVAKAFGAEVLACCSARNADQARALGADAVVDYAREDFSSGGARFDVILAANGYRPISHYRRALKPRGSYVAVGGSMAQLFQALVLGPRMSEPGGKTLGSMTAKNDRGDLLVLADLLARGALKPAIDRRFALGDAPLAFSYLAEGHARGKILVIP